MKILGFYFDSNPNVNYHVKKLIEKFYAKLWTLRHLKRAGLCKERMLDLYYSMIRSAVEYASVIYHSLIPKSLADQLERIQRQAIRIIYGWNIDTDTLMQVKDIDTLEKRREKAILGFALNNKNSEKNGKKWFKETKNCERAVRNTTREKYIVCLLYTSDAADE